MLIAVIFKNDIFKTFKKINISFKIDQDKQFISNCYKALNFTREIFNTSNMTIILSTDSNCSENTLCNVRFQYGIDY